MFLRFLSITIFLLFSVTSVASAETRQEKYTQSLIGAEELVKSLQRGNDSAKVREKAVILASKLKDLSFSESESRLEEKIAPPPGIIIESGTSGTSLTSTTVDIMVQQSGPTVLVSDVPHDWLTGYLEISREKIQIFLRSLSENPSPEKLKIQADAIKKAIERITQPPENTK